MVGRVELTALQTFRQVVELFGMIHGKHHHSLQNDIQRPHGTVQGIQLLGRGSCDNLLDLCKELLGIGNTRPCLCWEGTLLVSK